jgi:tRNA 2-selenouridine synthase
MAATVAHLDTFDEIVDARTPAEFAADHIPGALNRPVLYDAERVRVGTLYVRVSAFEAKKTGAALAARNIADHVERHFHDKPRDWRPLVYCWRGGQRSGAMVTVLRAIGWKAEQLEGGYKAFRRQVIHDLETLPGRFHYRVVCGPTGSGKSELLRALRRQGAQVLDLEAIAAHRGSVLGAYPATPQPGQKHFETRLWETFRHLDPSRPLFVEAESRKIGNLRVPQALMEAMRKSPCLRLDAPLGARVAHLEHDYRHYLDAPETLCAQLERLTVLHGHETVRHWQTLARQGHWNVLVEELLARHYDPAYQRSSYANFPGLATATPLPVANITPEEMERLARPLAAQD